ncbi:MAG: glutamate racemase [Bryobacterales bacterium]|nr:glutamate racemase [Bryobacterales bacterium]
MLIGVFDSGVGGLTVLRALHRKMPGHDFLYVGDTARVPYGRKPREMVETFARGIASFLLEQGVDALVIACNTASSASLPQLADEVPVPVWGVIEPGVAAAGAVSRGGRVGIIGTVGTIRSGIYQRKLEALGLETWARACPMFVHLVEEGLAESAEAELLAHHYLDDRPELDALILGCTHYPVLRSVIQRVSGGGVHLVDSAEAISETVSVTLANCPPGSGRITHFVTGDSIAYEHTAHVIGGVDGAIVPLPVADLVALQKVAAAVSLSLRKELHS